MTNAKTIQKMEEVRRIRMEETVSFLFAQEEKVSMVKEGSKRRMILEERISTAWKILDNDNDDGKFGRIFELFNATANSRKTHVSTAGETDNYIKWKGENKTVNRPAESKTNGGRIGEMIKRLESGKDTFLIYSMDICNSSTSGIRREIAPIICLFSVFYKCLLDCNAIKRTNGKQDEFAIQVSSKKLFERLSVYSLSYDPNRTYCKEDFEGLTM